MPMADPVRIPRFKFDVPPREDVGEAWVLVYEVSGGFSLVVTTEHGGDVDVFLTKSEFARLQSGISEISG